LAAFLTTSSNASLGLLLQDHLDRRRGRAGIAWPWAVKPS
jgi:hypothetical protein